MIRRFLFWFSSRLPCRLIDNGGQPYLERYFLFSCCGLTAYLHRFVGQDGDRDLHDHPWNYSLAIVLVGRYFEERLHGFDPAFGLVIGERLIRRFNLITGRDFHRISRTQKETWTLFMHGRRVKGWGFMEHVHQGDMAHRLDYYQPDLSGNHRNWMEVALRGCEADRQPLVATRVR